MSTLGNRLREAREKKGWSQTFVCKKLGISNSAMSGWERDYREPDAETISHLARLYEVSIDYLINGDKSPIDKIGQDPQKSSIQGELSDSDIDPEWLELFERVKEKGAELEATAILRSASNMSKKKLQAVLHVLELIEEDDG